MTTSPSIWKRAIWPAVIIGIPASLAAYWLLAVAGQTGYWALAVPAYFLCPINSLLTSLHLDLEPVYRLTGLCGIVIVFVGAGVLYYYSLVLLILWVRDRRRPWRHVLGFCKECGYNLTGNVSGICPECGTGIGEEGKAV
jgi:hypothetical protein